MFTNLTPVIQSSSKRCSHRKVHHHLRTMQHHPVPRGEHHLALPLSSGHSTLVLLLKPVCHLLLIGQPPGAGWGKCLSRERLSIPALSCTAVEPRGPSDLLVCSSPVHWPHYPTPKMHIPPVKKVNQSPFRDGSTNLVPSTATGPAPPLSKAASMAVESSTLNGFHTSMDDVVR